MVRTSRWAIGAALSLAFQVGCSAGLKVTPHTSVDAMSDGIVYQLPRTLLRLKIPYALVRHRVWPADAKGAPVKEVNGELQNPKSDSLAIELAGPIVVEPVTVADASLAFRIDVTDLSRFAVSLGDSTVKLTPEGILDSANLDFQGKGDDIVVSVIKTAGAAAKLAAIAGVDVDERIELEKREVIRVLDIGDLKSESGSAQWPYRFVYSDDEAATSLFQAAPNITSPRVTVSIAFATDPSTWSKTTAVNLLSTLSATHRRSKAHNSIDGLVISVPGPAVVSVAIDDVPQSSGLVTFARAGGYTWLPVRSHAFTDKKMGVILSSTSGGATQVSLSGTAAGAKASKALQESAEAAVAAAKELNTLAAQSEIDRLKKEKELLEAKLALEEARETPEGQE